MSTRPGRELDADILAAARDCIIERGVGRTTISEVARRAGVARPTVYHRYANVDTLARAVLTREVTGLIGVAAPTTAETLVTLVVQAADSARKSAFLEAVIQHDASLLVEYQFRRLGTSQVTVITALTEILRGIQRADQSAQEPGRILLREDDPRVMATFTLSITQSAIFSAGALAPHLPTGDTWRNELGTILKGYLTR